MCCRLLLFIFIITGGFYETDGPFGGHDTSWTDEIYAQNGGPISGVQLRAGEILNAIRVKYGTIWGPWHGGEGGDIFSFQLNSNETIIEVKGKGKAYSFYGPIISAIKFHTVLKTFGPYL